MGTKKDSQLDYQWGVLCALVGGYVSKNRIGELAAWGILADAFDRKDEGGNLHHELLEKNHAIFRAAIEKNGSELIGLACDLFIRQDK